MNKTLAYLTPAGAQSLTASESEEACHYHRIRELKTSRAAVEEWAKRIGLPCASGEVPCSRWSSASRSDSFWPRSFGELGGLDTVDATLRGDVVTIDFGDYLCSGPFR